MTLDEIDAISTTVQAIYSPGKEVISLTKDIGVKEKTVNLYNLVVELHEKLLNLTNTNSHLREELHKLRNWDQTKSEYILLEFAPGFFVYQKKQINDTKDPIYALCANCFHQQQISILQCLNPHTTGYKKYHCPRCKLEVDADI